MHQSLPNLASYQYQDTLVASRDPPMMPPVILRNHLGALFSNISLPPSYDLPMMATYITLSYPFTLSIHARRIKV